MAVQLYAFTRQYTAPLSCLVTPLSHQFNPRCCEGNIAATVSISGFMWSEGETGAHIHRDFQHNKA